MNKHPSTPHDAQAQRHTPTPWHVGMKPGPMVYGPLGEQVADCRGFGGSEPGYNAKYIVHCVNAHDELMAIVQNLASAWTSIEGDEEAFNELTAEASVLLTKLRKEYGPC